MICPECKNKFSLFGTANPHLPTCSMWNTWVEREKENRERQRAEEEKRWVEATTREARLQEEWMEKAFNNRISPCNFCGCDVKLHKRTTHYEWHQNIERVARAADSADSMWRPIG